MKLISILSKGKKNSKQQDIQNNKPVEPKLQFKYSYSIIPTNFVNLSEENQAQKMGQFFDILRVIEDRIKITMSRRTVPITVEGQTVDMPVMQVHLKSHQPLSDVLDQIKLEYISGDRPPKTKIVRENLNNMEIIQTVDENDNSIENENNNSVFAQCFSLYGLPATLPYAWITNIFQLSSQVQILINPVPKDEAITRMVRFKNIIYEDSKKDRSTAELYERDDDAENSLRRDNTGLYECIINCMVTAPDKKTLHANSKLFKKQVKRHNGSFAAVSAKQAAMLLENYGKKLTLVIPQNIVHVFPKVNNGGNSKNREEDLIEKAACIMAVIPWTQAFFDGNRRTGIIVAVTFLRDNGYDLDINPEDENLELRKLLSEIKKHSNDLEPSIMKQLSFYISKRLKRL